MRWLMNDVWERIWKNAIMAYTMYSPGISLQGLGKTTKSFSKSNRWHSTSRIQVYAVISIPVTWAQAVSRWFPTAAARIRVRARMWNLWWTKRHWGRFSPRTSVSPVNRHSANFSIIIISRDWHNRSIGGRSAEWTQLESIPHYTN
jgi:hypothetical protein